MPEEGTSFVKDVYDDVCGDAGNCVSCEIFLTSAVCPCLALRDIAQNVGYPEPIPSLLCLSTGFLCKISICYSVTCQVSSLACLGSKLAEKQGNDHRIEKAFARASWNLCTCYMCQALHESRLYKKRIMMKNEETKMHQVMERGEETDEESLNDDDDIDDDEEVEFYVQLSDEENPKEIRYHEEN